MQKSKIKSKAKLKLVELCETPFEENFVFNVSGDRVNAERFIHKMRVELSRLRSKLRTAGKTPALWKVLTIDIEELQTNEGVVSKVTLKRRKDPAQAILEDLEEITALVG